MGIVHFDEAKISTVLPIIKKMIGISGDIEVTEKVDGVNLRAGIVNGKFYTSTKRGSKVFDVDVPQAYDVDFLKQFAIVHEKLSGSNFVAIVDRFIKENLHEITTAISEFNSSDYNTEFTFEFIGSRSNVIAYDPLHVGSGALIILDISINGSSVTKLSVGEMLMKALKSQLNSELHVHTMLVHDLNGLHKLSIDVIKDFNEIEHELESYGSRTINTLQGRAKIVIDAIRNELITNWVDLQNANMLGGTEIEGLVIKDKTTGELVKLVNRTKFTKRLKQLWSFRNAANAILNKFQIQIAKEVFNGSSILTDLITVSTAPNFRRRYGNVTSNEIDDIANKTFNSNVAIDIIDELETVINDAWKNAVDVHDQLINSGIDDRVVNDNIAAETAQYKSIERQIISMRKCIENSDIKTFIRIITPKSRWQKKLVEIHIKNINEGGSAFEQTTSITREQYLEIKSDIFELMKKLGATEIREIGTTGKKSVMGDIDIVINISKEQRDDVIQQLSTIVGAQNIRRVGSSIISFAYEVNVNTFVQIDIMLSQHIDYVAWARSGTSNISNHKDFSRAKAVYRNMLFNIIAKSTNEIKIIDDVEYRTGYLIDRDTGLFSATRIKSKSRNKPWKTLEKQFVSANPVEITNILLGDHVKPSDVNTLEKLVAVIKQSPKTRSNAQKIINDFKESLLNLVTYDKRFSISDIEDVITLLENKKRGTMRNINSANQAIQLIEKASLGGFEYEYTVLGAIRKAGCAGAIKSPAGANAAAADADIRINNVNYGVEVKMDRSAQMGGSSIKWQYGVVGVDFITELDPIIKDIINEAMKTKVNVLIDFVDFVREYEGNENFWGFPGPLTRESWDEAQQQGVLAALQTRIPYDVSFITKHYSKKNIHYIQIGGSGLFHLESNPARLPIPALAGQIEIEIRAARTGTTLRKRDNTEVVGSGLRVQARLKAKGTSPYTLDDTKSIKAMLAVKDQKKSQRESLARNLIELFPVVTF